MLILRMEMMLNYLDRQVYVILMEVRTEVNFSKVKENTAIDTASTSAMRFTYHF